MSASKVLWGVFSSAEHVDPPEKTIAGKRGT